MDDYAVDTTQFRLNTDPYPAGVASLPTSLAGELERIRFVLKKVFGFTQWYTHTEPVVLPSGTTFSDPIISGNLTFSSAAAKIIPGATSLTLRNNANNADNILIADAGGVTFRAGLSGITTLALTGAQSGGTTLSLAGPITLTTAASKIIPGATSLSLRNNADSADNLLITNAGDATIRNNLVVSGAGPHAIGGATAAATQINIQGAFTATGGAGNAFGLEFGSSIIVQANQDAALLDIGGTLVEAGSGTHGTFSGLRLNIQQTLAAAAVTDFAAIRVLAGSALDAGVTTASGIKINAPTGATTNYALWVVSGMTRLFNLQVQNAIQVQSSGSVIDFQSFAGSQLMRLTDSGILLLGTTVTAAAGAGDLVLTNNAGQVRGVDSGGSTTYALIGIGSSNQVVLGSTSTDIQWGVALVALGGGAAPTFGTIGGSGPATAAQNTWMRVIDSSGAAFWVPVWK